MNKNLSTYAECYEAIMENPLNLVKCPIEYRNDLKLVSLATSNDPFAIIFASNTLKDSETLCESIVKNNAWIYRYISVRLKRLTSFISIIKNSIYAKFISALQPQDTVPTSHSPNSKAGDKSHNLSPSINPIQKETLER